MIGTIEAALIKLNQPLWNVAVDGFGNHDPGRGRYEQAKSSRGNIAEGIEHCAATSAENLGTAREDPRIVQQLKCKFAVASKAKGTMRAEEQDF